MSGSYEEVSNYMIGPFLREFLRIGDTFHLISFSDVPRTEISRRVQEAGDVETIIGRILLMYPLDPYSDISAALNYGERYVSSLPASRQKKIILISDGDHSPRQGASASGGGTFQDIIAASSARLNRMGVEFQYLSVPLGAGTAEIASRGTDSPAASPGGRTDSMAPASAASSPTGASSSAGTASSAAGTAGGRADSTAAPSSTETSPIGTADGRADGRDPASTAPLSGGQDIAGGGRTGSAGEVPLGGEGRAGEDSGPPVTEPSAESGGQGQTPGRTDAAPPGQPAPVRGPSEVPSRERSGGFSFLNLPLPALIALGLLLVLILALIIFFMIRRLHDSPNKAMAYASGAVIPSRKEDGRPADEGAKENAELLASFAATQRRGSGTPPVDSHRSWQDTYKDTPPQTGPSLLSLFVEDQNTAIGRRNIHMLKSGYSFTVGGGNSDYLIFLVPIPPHIAEIRSDGTQCTFIPRKSQFFPDIGSQTVPNCIGKTIRIISEKNYELKIRFERYEDPLLSLNRLLNSVSLPEK
jgi:hypothetical protein